MSSYGYDCSGFARALCQRSGVLLPRDAWPQAEWSGTATVNIDDLGDPHWTGQLLASRRVKR